MKHPHTEVIKAWVDGKQIEFRTDDRDKWTNLARPEQSNVCPEFRKNFQYRIKPEEVVDYTIVYEAGYPGANFFSTVADVDNFYSRTPRSGSSGYLKRTTIDGKVVKMEFIPK